MDLGEKLRQARLEAGLSQRQLCGDFVTRNMLSQIENGTARPSMATLQYLAGRLGKTVSWFLEEDALASPNQRTMEELRALWDRGDYAAIPEKLEAYVSPDPVYDRERDLLEVQALLALAQEAIKAGKLPLARELLARAEGCAPAYCAGELERRRLLLLARTEHGDLQKICDRLPSLDQELVLRADAAMAEGDAARAGQLLDAAGDRTSPGWNLRRGRAYLVSGDPNAGARCLHRAEERYPAETAPLLEQCYRELEDYKMAYFYACKQK